MHQTSNSTIACWHVSTSSGCSGSSASESPVEAETLEEDVLGAWVAVEESCVMPVSRLHASWCALFHSMLTAGQDQQVVRSLGAAVFGCTYAGEF